MIHGGSPAATHPQVGIDAMMPTLNGPESDARQMLEGGLSWKEQAWVGGGAAADELEPGLAAGPVAWTAQLTIRKNVHIAETSTQRAFHILEILQARGRRDDSDYQTIAPAATNSEKRLSGGYAGR
jgi:hypothetical protein